MEKADGLTGILVTIKVDGIQVLYIALFADGTLHRMGTGSEDNTDKDLFIGKSLPDLFERLRDSITPDLLRRIGEYADPSPKGKTCELAVGFQQGNGEELVSVEIRFYFARSTSGNSPLRNGGYRDHGYLV